MNPAAEFNPGSFDEPELNEKEELRALQRALTLGEGFSLIFARCNQPLQRQNLVTQIKHNLPDFTIQEVDFKEPIRHLLDELRWRIQDPLPNAIFVSGLEYSLPVAENADRTPVVANLNAARNSFAVHVRCPMVLWVPEYVLTAIMKGAPDFFSVRSGVYYFSAQPQAIREQSQRAVLENYSQANNLTLDDKLDRIKSIRALIDDYRLLPPAPENRAAEWRLLHRLGDIFKGLGRLNEAEANYTESLKIAQDTANVDEEITDLYGLGIIYAEQGKLTDAESAFNRSLEISQLSGNRLAEAAALKNLGALYMLQDRLADAGTALDRALEINRAEQGTNAEGMDLMNLAILSSMQEQYSKAEQYYMQSLAVSRKAHDRVNEAIALGNLGGLLANQRRFEEAQIVYEQSLKIDGELGDLFHIAGTLLNLGKLFADQGRLAEMERSLNESLRLYGELGDRRREGQCLHNMAVLYHTQGDVSQAFGQMKKAVLAFQQAQDSQGIETANRVLAQWQQESTAKT